MSPTLVSTPLVRARLASRRRRVRRIRQAVAAGMLATFIAFFAVVYVQMSVGKDPALGASSTKTIASATGATSAKEVAALAAARRRRAALKRARERALARHRAAAAAASAATTPAPVTTRQS